MAQKIGLEEVVGFLEGSLDKEGMKLVESDLAKPSGSESRAILERIARATKDLERFEDKDYVNEWLGIPADKSNVREVSTGETKPESRPAAKDKVNYAEPMDGSARQSAGQPNHVPWVNRTAGEKGGRALE